MSRHRATPGPRGRDVAIDDRRERTEAVTRANRPRSPPWKRLLAGALDYPGAPRLRSTIGGALTQLDGARSCSSCGVSFLGSAGLATLLESAAATEQHAADFRPRADSPGCAAGGDPCGPVA